MELFEIRIVGRRAMRFFVWCPPHKVWWSALPFLSVSDEVRARSLSRRSGWNVYGVFQGRTRQSIDVAQT